MGVQMFATEGAKPNQIRPKFITLAQTAGKISKLWEIAAGRSVETCKIRTMQLQKYSLHHRVVCFDCIYHCNCCHWHFPERNQNFVEVDTVKNQAKTVLFHRDTAMMNGYSSLCNDEWLFIICAVLQSLPLPAGLHTPGSWSFSYVNVVPFGKKLLALMLRFNLHGNMFTEEQVWWEVRQLDCCTAQSCP